MQVFLTLCQKENHWIIFSEIKKSENVRKTMGLWIKQKKQQNISEGISSYQELKEKILSLLYDYTEAALHENELEDELQRSQEEHRRLISACIRNCCSGNYGARETVLELIYKILFQKSAGNREMILRWIPFEKPEQMTGWQQMETLIFFFDREKEDQGFRLLCDFFGWKQSGTVLSGEKIREAYEKLCPVFSDEEKLRILSRLLFAETVGLGVIDTLNQQKGFIEEIQIGMSGKTEQQYNYKETLKEEKQKTDVINGGVYIMAHGYTIWLQVLDFKTEDEVQRVLRNLIKGAGGGELTRNHPMLVADTPDGRRISVSRPPMTDNWVGLIRKFDTIGEISLEALYAGYPEEKLLPELIRQLVRSGRNIAITGEMASGKTTLFRACLAEAKQDLNIRVIEAESFELNVRGFLPNANTVTMRVTERTPAEEVLAFARKTTGQVFAIGEINSTAIAAMAMDLSKIASQLFFSAHYITTEYMIADFVNAKLCVGGYSDESLAELEVVRCLGFDIHLRVKQGRRYVAWINEVVPVIQRQDKNNRIYKIRQIYRYDEENGQGVIVNIPSELSYERARQQLEKEEFEEFVRFFEK